MGKFYQLRYLVGMTNSDHILVKENILTNYFCTESLFTSQFCFNADFFNWLILFCISLVATLISTKCFNCILADVFIVLHFGCKREKCSTLQLLKYRQPIDFKFGRETYKNNKLERNVQSNLPIAQIFLTSARVLR